MALLVLLAAAAGAQVVAPGLWRLAHGFHPRAQALPELAQVVHRPDRRAESRPPAAGSRWAGRSRRTWTAPAPRCRSRSARRWQLSASSSICAASASRGGSHSSGQFSTANMNPSAHTWAKAGRVASSGVSSPRCSASGRARMAPSVSSTSGGRCARPPWSAPGRPARRPPRPGGGASAARTPCAPSAGSPRPAARASIPRGRWRGACTPARPGSLRRTPIAGSRRRVRAGRPAPRPARRSRRGPAARVGWRRWSIEGHSAVNRVAIMAAAPMQAC
jgi:hypothetical protein